MKYIVFTAFVVAAIIYGWLTVQKNQTLRLVVSNETAENIVFDVVGDGCKNACLNNTGVAKKLPAATRFEQVLILNKHGELRFMVRHASLGLNHLLTNDVAGLKAQTLKVTIESNRQIDVRFD